MGGGGKGGTSTSTVSIPPEVLARYNAVNARAEDVAKTPFQAYGGEFVAPMNTVQQQGVSQTQQYSGAAQPYYQQAAGLTQQAVDATKPLSAEQIQQYQNPYVQSVVDPTLKALQQQQAVDRQNQATQAIRAGAFGGERAGLQRAALSGQQELAQAQAISPLYAQAYQQAVSTAQQQQGQRTAGLMQAGQQIAGIGTGAQQAGLQGAQAVIGAGTLGQQTQQALDTAQYQQFLQERGYPFQTAQFLANIAEGTGALSGSTTTTTQPTSFFSDKRLKHDIKKIGKTNDGLPIYSFKYNGDDRTQIGLMAQDVEKKHPEAVGLAGGYKTVDYAKATAGARQARASGGGIMPRDLSDALLAIEFAPLSHGGAVFEPGAYNRGGYAGGGLIADPNDLQAILAAQRQAFGPFAAGGLYGASAQQDPHGTAGSYVPRATLPVPKLVTSSYKPQQQQAGLRTAMQDISAAGQTAETLSKGYDATKRGLFGKPAVVDPKTGEVTQKETTGLLGSGDKYDPSKGWFGGDAPQESARGGGIMPRDYYAGGGFLDPYKSPTSGSMVPEDVMQSSEETKDESEKLQPKSSGTGGGGGGGGGLGTALGVAKTAFDVGKFILPFFGLKDGGVVPRQHFVDGGTAQDPLSGYDPRDLAIRTIAAETGGHPDETAGIAAVIGNRLAGGKYGSDYRAVVTAPNQFEPWNNPNAPNYPIKIDPSSDRYKQAAAALSRYETEGYDPTSGATHFWAPRAQEALGRQAPSWGREGGIDIGATRFHKVDDGAPAARQTQQQQPQQQAGVKPWYDKMAPQTYKGEDQTMGNFLTSRDFVIPLLTGLGTMASSPSRYLGAAILQGLGGGAQAYASLQKQQADIDRTRGETTVGLSGIPPENLIGQFNKQGKLEWTVRKPTGPGQLGLGAGAPSVVPGVGSQPMPEVSGAPAAPQAPTLQPIKVDTSGGGYRWEIKPTAQTDQYFSQYGQDPYTIRAMIAQSGGKTKADSDEKIADATRVAAANAPEAKMKIGQLTDELNRLANSSSRATGAGPAQPERAAAVNLYNYLAGLSGLPGLQLGGADRDITSSQIINKIQQDFGSSQAQNRGFHAGYIADALTQAFPTGSMTPEAARKMSAALYIGNQMASDFARYYDNYRQKYGTAYSAKENFLRDMGPQYDQDKKTIEAALQKPGLVEYLRSHPEKAAEFDAYWKRPGLARTFIGG